MTEKEFFVETIADEAPRFDRVFKSLPQGMFSHTHHPKSKTAEELVLQMTGESESFTEFLKSGTTDWSVKYKKSGDFEAVYDDFAKNLKVAGELAKNMTEEEWIGESKATFAGKEIWKTTKNKMAWGLLLDLIHHRGQLSTYIRPMGGKVPSIYGPSGDMPEA